MWGGEQCVAIVVEGTKYELASWPLAKQQKIEGVELLNKATLVTFRGPFVQNRG